VIAVMLVLSVFSLRAGFFYPQEGNERQSNYGGLTGWAIQFENDAPKRLRIGYTDSGALGYFSRHEIINLDGVVNNRVLQYIKQGRFSDYLELMKLDEVYVDPERLQIYDYRKWKKVTEIRP
jgi:hypothetical protein